MDGTELLNQMNAFGTECETVWALRVYSDLTLGVTATTTLHKNNADQRMTRWGRNTTCSNHKSKAKRSSYLVQQTVS